MSIGHMTNTYVRGSEAAAVYCILNNSHVNNEQISPQSLTLHVSHHEPIHMFTEKS